MTDKPIDIRFTMDISKFDAALQKLEKAAAAEALGRVANAGALVFVAHAKINVEEQFTIHPTGPLKASLIVGRILAAAQRAIAEWGSYGIVYNRIHEFGGIIQATNGPYLVFKTADGAWHTVPFVDMPARPFMRPAKDQNQDEAKRAMLAVLVREIRAAGVAV